MGIHPGPVHHVWTLALVWAGLESRQVALAASSPSHEQPDPSPFTFFIFFSQASPQGLSSLCVWGQTHGQMLD